MAQAQKKGAPLRMPHIVLSLSLSENRGRVSIYAYPLTGIYAVRKWRMLTLSSLADFRKSLLAKISLCFVR